jgi:sulfatase modifying factor 1
VSGQLLKTTGQVVERSPATAFVPRAALPMGSGPHYREEAPSHYVSVTDFWKNRTPVTNRRFLEFIEQTGDWPVAELARNPSNYPGALPELLYAGSRAFSHPAWAVDRRDTSQWWQFLAGAFWRAPYWPESIVECGFRFAARGPC